MMHTNKSTQRVLTLTSTNITPVQKRLSPLHLITQGKTCAPFIWTKHIARRKVAQFNNHNLIFWSRYKQTMNMAF